MKPFARGLALMVLGLLVLGFGVCGAMGTVVGVMSQFSHDHDSETFGSTALTAGLIGLLIAFGAGVGFAVLLRKGKAPPPPP